MARPTKTGLSYYPLDCDFLSDEKVIAVKANCGAKGIAVMIALLCAIYRQGYYAQWNEMMSLKIANDLPGVTGDAVQKVVEILVRYDFFDKGLYSAEKILTSAAIQRRYFEVTRKRTTRAEYPYLLVSAPKTQNLAITAEKTEVSAPKTPVSGADNATNKTKLNKTKLKPPYGGSQGAAPPAPAPEIEVGIGEVLRLRELPQVAPLVPSVADCEAFHAYYAARGWLIDGRPIRSLAAAFVSWLRRRSDQEIAAARRARRKDEPPEISDEERHRREAGAEDARRLREWLAGLGLTHLEWLRLRDQGKTDAQIEAEARQGLK